MIKMFNIPNLFTAANLICGIFAILLSLTGFVHLAPFILFLAMFFDFLDGFLARLLKQQSELGKQLDSLADMISFGLAPGIFMLVILIQITGVGGSDYTEINKVYFFSEKTTDYSANFLIWFDNLVRFKQANFIPLIGLLIPFMSLFRLAKFNIDTRQTESFIGLPTPANTLFFCMFPLLISSQETAIGVEKSVLEFVFNPIFIISFIVLFSVLLVSEIPLFSLKIKRFSWKGNEIKFSFLITCLLIIFLTGFWSFGIIVLLYIILSIVENNFINKKQHEI
jgi:CDP-diacylglycerol---serine O-phosphatidyltransferase